MYQLRLLGILIRPSLMGFIGSILFASFLLLINNASHILGSQLVSLWLGTDHSQLTQALKQIEASLNVPEVNLTFLDVPIAYNIVVLIAAVISGLLVYFSLESVSRGAESVREDLDEIKFAKERATKKAIGLEISARLMLRLGAIVGWVTYLTFWSNFILPYSVSLSRIGLEAHSTLAATGYISAAVILLALSIHLHIVFLRLVLLKPRIFGGLEVIENEMYK